MMKRKMNSYTQLTLSQSRQSEVVVAYVADLKGKDRRRYFNPSIFNPFNFARVR